jgi:hypothetical protein
MDKERRREKTGTEGGREGRWGVRARNTEIEGGRREGGRGEVMDGGKAETRARGDFTGKSTNAMHSMVRTHRRHNNVGSAERYDGDGYVVMTFVND